MAKKTTTDGTAPGSDKTKDGSRQKSKTSSSGVNPLRDAQTENDVPTG
jgi:hypothetical protein